MTTRATLAPILLAAVLAAAGCTRNATETVALSGDYLGQTPPGATAELFAPGVVSTGLAERDVAMTPDGSELYFTVVFGSRGTIVAMRRIDGVWTAPKVAPFSGTWNDIEPAISPDGKRFFFVSARPKSAGAAEPGDTDVWVMERTAEGWTEPANLGAPVNSTDNEYFPSVTRDGTMYFTRRTGGREALYRSALAGGRYQDPELLPEQINTTAAQFNSFVAPDESFLIFGSLPREGGFGSSDYLVSFRKPDGSWTEAVNMGPAVNSPAGEWSASLSPDGRYLFFQSTRSAVPDRSSPPLRYAGLRSMLASPGNGQSDIYWIDASFIGTLRPR